MHKALVMISLLLMLSVSCTAVPKADYPLGIPGSITEYTLVGGTSDRPEFESKGNLSVTSAAFSIGKTEKAGKKSYQWFCIGFKRGNGDSYRAWFLLDGFPKGKMTPDVTRYIWFEAGWPDPVEYINAASGKAELPRLSIWKYGWPRSIDNSAPTAIAPGKSAPSEIYFLGYKFKFTRTSSTKIVAPGKATAIKLRPDALVGLAGTDKDRLGRHADALGPNYQYEYDAPPSKQDVQADIDSGLNMFFNHKKAGDWMFRTNCYVTGTYIDWEDWPLNLYRSNFYGRGWHVDEPCVYLRIDLADKKELANKLAPAEAARTLEQMCKSRYNAHNGQYGRDTIAMYAGKYFGLGNIKLVDAPYPVWENYWDTGWYELAGSDTPCALVDEDVNEEVLIQRINMAFGTQIPALLENACEIRIALGRGAARNFNKSWGTSNYAYSLPALNPQPDMASFKYMYDAGASYFYQWFGWVGLTDAQVPYSYKRFHAEAMQKYIAMNPKRDMNKLLHAADTCVVLPYGYTFSPDRMFKVKWLPLDRKNTFGLTYRHVLSSAAVEIEKLLRNATKFDIAFDDPRFISKGYKQLIYVRENGKIDIYKDSIKTKSLTGPADMPKRADLGPGPKAILNTTLNKTNAPTTISVKVSAEPGTGELARSLYVGQPVLIWTDVLAPDGDNMSTDMPEFNINCPVPGVYKIRTATSDCFGRPAIAEKEIIVE